MHDIKAIRADPEAFDAGLKRRSIEKLSHSLVADYSNIVSMKGLQEADTARQKELARLIGQAKATGNQALANELLEQATRRKDITNAGQEVASGFELALNARLSEIPNLPAPDVPDGLDETTNVVVHTRGTQPTFAFAPLEHDTLALRLGYDPEAAAAIAGARFAVLKGPLARLHRALALLQERAGTVAEVGYQVGFSSPAHFSTVFSRQFGYPPSEVARQ